MASITIIACDADDPDALEQMTSDERKERSGGWKEFPLRSGKRLDTFVMFATHHDFGVFGSSETVDGEPLETSMIFKTDLGRVIPILEQLVETEPEQTARALQVHGGGTADLARITDALRSDEWPASDEPAIEAAAFAHQLLVYARMAKASLMGVCWEVRGPLRAFLSPPPTARTRELEQLYARLCKASSGLGYMEFWEHGGRSSASPEEIEQMERDVAETTREYNTTKDALAVLVAKLRAEAPAELDAWAFAHYCYVSQYLHQAAEAKSDDTNRIERATAEREEWAKVRAGSLGWAKESSWVPLHEYFYKAYFGLDPKTLEPCD